MCAMGGEASPYKVFLVRIHVFCSQDIIRGLAMGKLFVFKIHMFRSQEIIRGLAVRKSKFICCVHRRSEEPEVTCVYVGLRL